jgi:Mn2+/Fe2+ NRAMP family transporter
MAGIAILNLIAVAIIITTAATLHANGNTDIQSSAKAAEVMKPLAGAFEKFNLCLLFRIPPS